MRNNGRPFDANDWSRLKKIAEGNPDEQKIGFFGVGFYSLFSICEEPFVISGDRCLAFHWKGDQLYARHGASPEGFDRTWTCIFLKLREPLARPHLDSLAHFLTKALLFTAHLESIAVYSAPTDRLFRVAKKRASSSELPIPPSAILSSMKSKPTGLFSIRELKTQAIQLDLQKDYVSEELRSDRSFLGSILSLAKNIAKEKHVRELEERLRRPGTFSTFLHTINVDLKVSVSAAFSAAIERVTKKRPAASANLSLLYATFDEMEASDAFSLARHPVLAGVLPTPETGRIFIGFETHQTTGCAVHLAGPFIPTVERESLDFVEKSLACWNEELIRIGAKVMRLVHQVEMEGIAKLYSASPPDEAYWRRAVHVVCAFGFGPSSPSPAPALLSKLEFYANDPQTLLFPSSQGIVPVSRLRMIPRELASFIRDIPTLDSERLAPCRTAMEQLKEVMSIPTASFVELMESLKDKRLPPPDLSACLHWIISMHHSGQLGARSFYALVASLLVPVGQGPSSELYVALANVTYYPGRALVHEADLPLPPSCLSPNMAERVPGHELAAVFSLKELPLVTWIEFLDASRGFGDPDFCERVLVFLAKQWPSLDESERPLIASCLSQLSIVPTRKGMRKPTECYLEEVRVFGDVATVHLVHRRAIPDSFLIAIGVQSHIDISSIFSRLGQLDWDHRQLIKYLLTIESQLSRQEIEQLASARIFPAVGSSGPLFSLQELYLEDPAVKLLSLPVLDWKHGYGPSAFSDSTRFMIKLGLRDLVPLEILISSIPRIPETQRFILYRYFIDHFGTQYRSSYDPSIVQEAFISSKEGVLYTPTELFSDEGLALLGFPVLHPDLHPFSSMFGIAKRPPLQSIVGRLAERQFDRSSAAQLFSYLAPFCAEFPRTSLEALSTTEFVPTDGDRWMRPRDLFFSRGKFDFGDAFTVVDFGPHARSFLLACGVQDEPQSTHICEWMCKDPISLWRRIGAEGYLDVLRWLALQYEHLPRASVRLLRHADCLIGVDYICASQEKEKREDEEGAGAGAGAGTETDNRLSETRYVIANASNLYIIDDIIAQQAFRVLSIPADPTLEQFYLKLGSQSLSSSVKVTWTYAGTPADSQIAAALRQLIRQRAPLLVSEQSSAVSSKVNPKALEQLLALDVAAVDSIVITRVFHGRTHEQHTSACFQHARKMLITTGYDFFDVANVLGRIIYSGSARLPDALLISTLLSSSLSSLRAKGFAVDRLLGKRPEKEAVPHVEPQGKEDHAPPRPPPETIKPTTARPPPAAEPLPKVPPPLSPHGEPSGRRARDSSKHLLSTIAGAITERVKSMKPAKPRRPEPSDGGNIDESGMRRTLERSIRGLKNYDQASLITEDQIEETGTGAMEEEADAFCEIVPGSSLQYFAQVEDIPVYVSTDGQGLERVVQSLSLQSEHLCSFGMLLHSLRGVFGAPPKSLHIFYDTASRSIAFNRGHTLFFNFAHYERQMRAGMERRNVLASWFMTFCHELAHNFVGYACLFSSAANR